MGEVSNRPSIRRRGAAASSWGNTFSSAWKGKRVVGEINLACRQCLMCQKGLGRHCPQRTVLGIAGHPGSHAEWLTLPPAEWEAVRGAENRAAHAVSRLVARVDEMITGVRSQVAVKLFGEDLAALKQTGDEIARVLKPGGVLALAAVLFFLLRA